MLGGGCWSVNQETSFGYRYSTVCVKVFRSNNMVNWAGLAFALAAGLKLRLNRKTMFGHKVLFVIKHDQNKSQSPWISVMWIIWGMWGKYSMSTVASYSAAVVACLGPTSPSAALSACLSDASLNHPSHSPVRPLFPVLLVFVPRISPSLHLSHSSL